MRSFENLSFGSLVSLSFTYAFSAKRYAILSLRIVRTSGYLPTPYAIAFYTAGFCSKCAVY